MRQLAIHAKPVADVFTTLRNALRASPANMRMLGRSAQAAIPALQNLVPALTSAITPLGDFAKAADVAATAAGKLRTSLGGIRIPSLSALNSGLSQTASSAKQTQGIFSKLFQTVTLGFFNSERSANRFGNTVSQMSRRAIAGLFGIRSAIGAIGIAFAAGVAVRWMANVTSDAEQAQVSFEALTGSAGKARTMLRQIQDLADRTPLELPEVREGARSLVAFNYPAKHAVDTLRMIGDVAQGSQVPLNDLVQMYGKAFETNRVNGEAFRQFGRRGVRVVSELAEMMGVSTQKIREMGSRGELTFKDLDAAFKRLTAQGGPFNNMLAKMGASVHGRFTTMVDSVRALAKELGLALAPAAKAGINVLITLFDEAKAALVPFMPQIRRFAAGAATAFKSFGDSIKGSIPIIFKLVHTAVVVEKAWLKFLGGVVKFIGGKLSNAIGGISVDLEEVLDTVEFMAENWRLFFDLIVANTGMAMFNAWEQVRVFFVNIGNMLSWVKDHFWEAFLTAADIILGIMENLGKNIREIMAAAWDFAMGRGFQPALVKLTAGTEQAMARLMSQLPKAVHANIVATTPEIEALLKKINEARAAFDEQKKKDAEEAAKQEAEEELDEGRMPREGGGKTEKFAFKELTQFARDIQKGVGPEQQTAQNTAATAKGVNNIFTLLRQRGFGAGNALPPGLLTGAFHPTFRWSRR